MRHATAVVVLVALFTTAASRPATAPIERLQWLGGCWIMESGTRITEEQWMQPRAGTMLGMSRTVRDGRVLEHEAIRIYTDADGTLVYAAAPSGQQPAEFRATTITDDSASFANPAHDFPQRITYRRIGSDSMQASIEGPRNGTTRRIPFDFRRTSCDAPAPTPRP